MSKELEIIKLYLDHNIIPNEFASPGMIVIRSNGNIYKYDDSTKTVMQGTRTHDIKTILTKITNDKQSWDKDHI